MKRARVEATELEAVEDKNIEESSDDDPPLNSLTDDPRCKCPICNQFADIDLLPCKCPICENCVVRYFKEDETLSPEAQCPTCGETFTDCDSGRLMRILGVWPDSDEDKNIIENKDIIEESGKDVDIEEDSKDVDRTSGSDEILCCFCNVAVQYFGHSAEPVQDGRCCSDCNNSIVEDARLAEIE
jgi:hypothetical protein